MRIVRIFLKCLTFGLRSAPKLFDDYAQRLQQIMYENGVTCACHYLDDSYTVSSEYETCYENLKIMLKTCREPGFEIQTSKTVHSSTCVECSVLS